MKLPICAFLLALFLPIAHSAESAAVRDSHSYTNAGAFRTTHLSLDLRTDFERRELVGSVALSLDRLDPKARELVLDTRDLSIERVELVAPAQQALTFRLGAKDPILGAPLHIDMPSAAGAKPVVRISYRTSPGASGLQWVEPSQAAGKKHPFLYSQSQAVHARSWIPLQDTPAIRITYDARIRTPRELLAVMSADNDPNTPRDGDYSFRMPQPVPSYLLALAVGDLAFLSIGPRTGVYAEPATVSAAHEEFRDVESMLRTCESLFGPYRWGRYDLLVLPPSFMWGGMENPRLSFITPALIAGDRSLVAVIAHELAHSWSGNLVTNANWESIWLNEGFTTYLERRIVEALYGTDRRAMEDVLGLQSLQRDMADLKSQGDEDLTRLAIDLRGRDPDDGFSDVAYEKGRLFVGFLESRLGRERLDAFLREYFSHFAFQSLSTEQFLDYLNEKVLSRPDAKVTPAEVKAWMNEPGLPATAVLPQSDAFAKVDAEREAWLAGTRSAVQLNTKGWTTHQWLHFLDNLPADIPAQRLEELDRAWKLNTATNSEIAFSWLRNVIRAGYSPGYPRLEQYLTSLGRRKVVKPLYEELMKTEQGAALARRIYAKARSFYQIPLAEQLDRIVTPTELVQ
jgi:leukotriene-A4 hydrolase